MRLYFLDKSASMGFDQCSITALSLATQNALAPKVGSSLVFLLAGPHETQVFFRRPGDAPLDVSVNLGSCTWFNEPILRSLMALAPAVEALSLGASIVGGEPPLQVICLTDGMDNCSPASLTRLPALVNAVRQITGPSRGEVLYRPVVGRQDAESPEAANQVPVWLLW